MPVTDPTSLLLAPGSRLPAIKRHLLGEIWSSERYGASAPAAYLKEGERAVQHLEEMIALAAPKVWDELAAESSSAATPSPHRWFGMDQAHPLPGPRAMVVFDGLSLRELPLILRLAAESGLHVVESSAVATAMPTETVAFVEERLLGVGAAPSQLPGRRDLRDRNVRAYYLDQPNSREVYPPDHHLLVWSSYPDRLYGNDEARTDALFEQFHELIPTIWKYTVQAIPPGMPIVVTSDHGYVYFGPNLESGRSTASEAPGLLNQRRSRTFEADEALPNHPDLQIVHEKRLAMIRGRIRTRPSGKSATRRYQHDGFSLMEVLVPWVELRRDPVVIDPVA